MWLRFSNFTTLAFLRLKSSSYFLSCHRLCRNISLCHPMIGYCFMLESQETIISLSMGSFVLRESVGDQASSVSISAFTHRSHRFASEGVKLSSKAYKEGLEEDWVVFQKYLLLDNIKQLLSNVGFCSFVYSIKGKSLKI